MSGTERIPLTLPRHAANPRGVGRAAEVWRLFQEAAVIASIRVGWPPERYTESGTGFVVYGMTVRHDREVVYGEPLEAETWVPSFARGILSRREIRLSGPGGPVAATTQRWVHVGPGLKPARASPELLRALTLHDRGEPELCLPTFAPLPGVEGAGRSFSFEVWHTWMDPLGHVNHPAYVDFCDEATCRALAAAGLDPQQLVPVAEQVDWKRGAVAGERVVVRTCAVGLTGAGDAVLSHQIVGEGEGAPLYATATTVRRLLGGTGEPLLRALG